MNTKHKRSVESPGMDLVLINPASRTSVYQSLGSELSAIEPPVWAGLMAEFIRNRGFTVHILDAEAEELTSEAVTERLGQWKPLLVAVVAYGHQPSASTQIMTAAGALCSSVKDKSPQTKVALVGGHVAALPERTLREEDVDFVVGGEGPYTLLELLGALKSQRPDYRKVRGLWFWEDGSIQWTPAAPLVRNLDMEMSGVAWDLLPMSRYRAHNWHCLGSLERKPYAALYTTLGCPYHCSFCCIQSPFKSGEELLGYKQTVNSYRFWSPASVLRQIDLLVHEYDIRNIKIADEMFVLNPKHVNEICHGLIERDYGLNFWAYARVDTVREGMLDELKRAGFNWLAFGIESASERVRNDMQKGFGQDLVYKTIEKVRAAGINVIGNFIFGLPEDNAETLQATLDLALDLNCEFANFYCAMAYPGSKLYQTAVSEGWPLPEKWSGYSQHAVDSLPLPTRHLTSNEVLRFRDHAFQVYFNSPKYLDLIERKFSPEAAGHIRDMASQRLDRKYA